MATFTAEQFDTMIDRHFRFEAEDDVEGVLSTMVDDLSHELVGAPSGVSRGKQAAQQFYESLFADLAGEEIKTVKRLYGKDFVVDESIWKGKAVGAPLGLPGRGRPLTFRLLHIFEMAEDGKIRQETVWIDYAAIARQLGND